MKLLVVLVFLSASTCHEIKNIKKKRGVFNEGNFVGGLHNFGPEISLSHDQPVQLNHGPYIGPISLNLNHLDTSKYSYGSSLPTIDLGSTIHKHITVTKNIGIPVPQPYAVPIENKIAVPVPHAVPVPVDKPYPVQILKPYAVPVDKPYPVTVEKQVPYPVNVPVQIPVSVPVAVPVPKPVAVPVHKAVPFIVPEPVPLFKTVPVRTPVVAIGSGSLGYTHLGNGAYALGSGSLGITQLQINGKLQRISKLW